MKKTASKKTGKFDGKSNKLGHGGRAAQLNSKLKGKGMPKAERGAVIGKIARMKKAAPGQKNYHSKVKKAASVMFE